MESLLDEGLGDAVGAVVALDPPTVSETRLLLDCAYVSDGPTKPLNAATTCHAPAI